MISCPKCQTQMKVPLPQGVLPAMPVQISSPASITPSSPAPTTSQAANQAPVSSGAPSGWHGRLKTMAEKLKSTWQGLSPRGKAAVLGGSGGFVLLSFALCCGVCGVFSFFGPRKDGNSPQVKAGSDGGSQAVAKVDFTKGPKGEEIIQVEEAKEKKAGFKNKNGKFVSHGPYILFYDQVGGKKMWEGEKFDGQWHGKLTGWYKDGSLSFERWYDKGKPVGTHKGYDGRDKIVWTLRFEDGNPNLAEVDCFCVVCQIAFLYGSTTWNKARPFNEDCTLFTFTKGIRSEIPETEFLWLMGQPQDRHDVLPNRYEQDWVYRCKDGIVTCRLVKGRNPLTMTQTKVNGNRKF